MMEMNINGNRTPCPEIFFGPFGEWIVLDRIPGVVYLAFQSRDILEARTNLSWEAVFA